MNRAVTVMWRSADESHCADRPFCSSSDLRHTNFTNFSIPYHQPVNVSQHHSSQEYQFAAPCVSHGCIPPCSVQIPNPVVSDPALFSNNYPYMSCQSVLPDKQWCQKHEVGSTSRYAVCMQTHSEPFRVEAVAPPQVSVSTLPSPPVECGKSRNCDGETKDCGNAYAESCSRVPIADLSKASSSGNSTDPLVSSVESVVMSGSDSKVDIATTVSAVVTVTTSSSATAVTPRPKCGRAKTNAELKRQLMERREQRLRDMLESSPESTTPSCTHAIVVSVAACKQTEAVVSYCSVLIQTSASYIV